MSHPPYRPFGAPHPSVPPTPPTFHRFNVVVFRCLAGALALAWLLAIFNPGGRFAGSLFLAVLATALILDWRGFLTLRGAITWQGWGIALGVGYVVLFPVTLGAYLYRVYREPQRAVVAPESASGPMVWPMAAPRNDPRQGALFGVICLGLITVCGIALTTTSPSGATQAPTQQVRSSTNTPHPAATSTQAGVGQTQVPAATPTATDVPTATATGTDTPTVTTQPAPTNTPKPVPTDTPKPKPTATAKPSCDTGGAPSNPWCYTFNNTGKVINNPPNPAFCNYFNCIPSFWDHTNGYVMECKDGTYSHSGGVSGSCSSHKGNLRPLYQP